MRLLRAFAIARAVVGSVPAVSMHLQAASTQQPDNAAASAEPKAAATGSATATPVKSLQEVIRPSRASVLFWGTVLTTLMIIGAGVLLWRNTDGTDPVILRLNPSFFFWLGMMYAGLLLLTAVIYDLIVPLTARPILLGGVVPIAIPWFGALGAVTISLEGVFLRNSEWDTKFNYWHIGRPVFGAVLGIVAFFLFVVIVSAAGTTPKFFDDRSAPVKDYIVFYVVAFLVGYREETFRELIKRASDLILKPGTPASAPAVTFKIGGTASPLIQVPDSVGGARTSVTVEVQNSGTAPLASPVVTITPVAPTPTGAFAIANDPGGRPICCSS